MIQNKNSTGKKQVQIMMITTESSQDESESMIVEEKRARKHVKLQSAVMTNDSEVPQSHAEEEEEEEYSED